MGFFYSPRDYLDVRHNQLRVLPQPGSLAIINPKLPPIFSFKILIDNDLASNRKVQETDVREFAGRLNMYYIETSAKTAVNVKQAFMIMTINILEKV